MTVQARAGSPSTKGTVDAETATSGWPLSAATLAAGDRKIAESLNRLVQAEQGKDSEAGSLVPMG